MNKWEKNAKYVEEMCGAFVDWEERFYICPECEEPIYESDWTNLELNKLCPVCELEDEE